MSTPSNFDFESDASGSSCDNCGTEVTATIVVDLTPISANRWALCKDCFDSTLREVYPEHRYTDDDFAYIEEGSCYQCDGRKVAVIMVDVDPDVDKSWYCTRCFDKAIRRLGQGDSATKHRATISSFEKQTGYCSTCCPTPDKSAATCSSPRAHHIIHVDLGKGMLWYCSICFDKRVDELLAPKPTSLAVAASEPEINIDGDTMTVDGITFQF